MCICINYLRRLTRLQLMEVMSIRKGQHRHPQGSSRPGGWALRLLFIIEIELGNFTTDLLSLLLLFLLLDDNCIFLHSFVPWRSLITETCSRTSIITMLRPQNGLGQKWLFLCQESHAWFSFSTDPLPSLLTHTSFLFSEILLKWSVNWRTHGN